MASISGFKSWVAGATGSQGELAPQASWKVYVLPRGAHASQASSGAIITFDSASAAARFTANYWVQVGTNTSNIRQVSAVAGNSINVGTAVTVAENDRIFLVGTTQPTVTGGSASYQPHTTIWARDDDQGTPVTNSMLTTDSNGGFEFFAHNNFYDAIIQDSNRSAQMSLVDIAVGVTATVQLNVPRVYNVKDPDFGAIGGNNSAVDDRAAIQSAIDAAATASNGSQGAVVFLPRDTYHIDAQLVVKDKVRLVGEGRRNSIIKAGDNWSGSGTASALIRLGEASATSVFNCTAEQLWIHCNNKSGSVGVFSAACNEGSGLREVLISAFENQGVSFNAVTNRNFRLSGLEFSHSNTAAWGMMMACGEVNTIEDVTFDSDGTQSANPALYMSAGIFDIRRIHCENHDTGIKFDGTANGKVDSATGNATVDALIWINNEGVNVLNAQPGGSTSTIYNEITGKSHTSSAGARWYQYSDFGSTKSLISDDNVEVNYQNAQYTFGSTVSFNGSVVAGSVASISPATAGNSNISVANESVIQLDGSGAIVGLKDGAAWQEIEFFQNSGRSTWVRGTTLALSAATLTMDIHSMLKLRASSTGLSWIQVSFSGNSFA